MEKAKLGASNCTYPLWLPAKQLWSGYVMSPDLSVFISRMGTATSTTQKDHEDHCKLWAQCQHTVIALRMLVFFLTDGKDTDRGKKGKFILIFSG